jgi:fibronectin type III domain protein
MGGDRSGRTRRRVGARVAVVAVVLVGLVGLAPSPSGAATGPPSPPRSVRPFPGNGQATLKWHPPDHLNGFPVTQWKIIAYNNRNTPLPTRIFTSPSTTYVYPGLSNSREYTFTVAAKNRKGWSASSARSNPVRIGVPEKPAMPKATAGIGRAVVTWKTPKGNGAFVKAYVVTPYLDGTKQAKARAFNSPNTKQVVTGLHRQRRYTFTVTARNNRGSSTPSKPSAAILTK